ncbi:hypothetical protein [Oscillibacter sp.]|uniref:hypothetical protein n=1 Tax=Oscillibacter sp. TaxID=1945593 RepID=UPI00289C6114|nr:hypothetical protein [Oscillibacter sp.]
MSEETKTQQDQQTQQPDTTHPEDNGASSGKTFTQEEVNKIVAERLARERTKAQPTESDQKAAALDAKEKEFAHREMMSEFKETVAARGYPKGLADVLKGSTPDELKTALRLVDEAFYSRSNTEEPGKISGATPAGASPDSLLRQAFGLKKKGK